MASRRSERNKNKRTPSVDPLYEQDNSEDATLTEDDAPAEPHKKSKSSKRRRIVRNPAAQSTESKTRNAVQLELQVGRPDRGHIKGRRGHLKQMTEMPLDTLHEIFRDLEPIDLLHLSWASKSLRAIVMEKSARYIWEDAFERLYALNKPPPRCPEDLNLAQYTRFIFKKQCMACGIANGRWTSWSMRIRACWKCLTCDDCFMRYDSRVAKYDSCLLLIHAKDTYFCLRADYLEVSKERSSDMSAFYAQKMQLNEAKTLGTKAYEEWTKQCSDGRKEVLAQMRVERQTAILNKLAEIGWKESEIKDITQDNVTGNLASSMRAKKLTDSEWKGLQPTIVKHLEELKERHLAPKREAKLCERWQAFRLQFELWEKDQILESFWRPCAVDLAILEPFRSIIFTPSLEDGDFPLDKVDCVAQEWMRKRDDSVLSVLPQDIQTRFRNEHDTSKTSLQPLAFLQFNYDCFGPNTIAYVCEKRHSVWGGASHPKEYYEISNMLSRLKCSVRPWFWTSHHLKFSIKGSEVSKDVIRLFGLDEGTATLSQLNQCKKKFICLHCRSTGQVVGQGWLEMVQHEMHRHRDKADGPLEERWSEMTPEDEPQI
ncbi:hypothetical protein P691DRAFT_73214 [Macrolepiota fuliginosa MF-IS2]|uniref:F-box domain-containing protein n=1 Tax=Macrolepiota fuliginosa MF-IS2 TaxID=1400762 RepID=A0A9P5XEE2_9AGAR|nr:hypothetical protein P691DRAFT_73214 [Macrolepiota fuliginosa MF-IS2]